MIRRVPLFVSAIFFCISLPAGADIIKPLPGKSLQHHVPTKSARGIEIEESLRNDQSAFVVRIDVCQLSDAGQEIDLRKDGVFLIGECMGVKVRSEQAGYLYLLYKQADGKELCLFPNEFDNNNQIPANEDITIPTTASQFNLRVSEPPGDEVLIAIVTRDPIPPSAFGSGSLTKSTVTDINLDTFIEKGMQPELRKRPASWAEHSVRIKVVNKAVQKTKKRLGLFVGISHYKDSRVGDLQVCHDDAKVMSEVLKQHGQLDGAGVLVNDQATLANVQQALKELKLNSQPGDDIFVYWSGHGGTCADTDDEEQDGLDEFLVPFDANPEKIQETVILDDTFGRWIQELDGRRVVVILDACFSGGQFAGEKSIETGTKFIKALGDADKQTKTRQTFDELLDSVKAKEKPVLTSFDFLDSELTRIKDIGQDDAAMLFSSASSEISAERKDGKLSVMTHFLAKNITETEPVTLRSAFDYVSVEVPKYMLQHYPGREQTPQLHGHCDDVRLR